MSRTRIVATEVATPTTAGTASSISSATVVRLHNDTGSIVQVAVSTQVSAASTTYFTMPANSVEFLEKYPAEVIHTNSAIKAAKVGYTG
jgi:hypothetical protein|tara:strand:- start:103 stop:369 length:267 start_codon:yes stop_codon:yes gene_type:complete